MAPRDLGKAEEPENVQGKIDHGTLADSPAADGHENLHHKLQMEETQAEKKLLSSVIEAQLAEIEQLRRAKKEMHATVAEQATIIAEQATTIEEQAAIVTDRFNTAVEQFATVEEQSAAKKHLHEAYEQLIMTYSHLTSIWDDRTHVDSHGLPNPRQDDSLPEATRKGLQLIADCVIQHAAQFGSQAVCETSSSTGSDVIKPREAVAAVSLAPVDPKKNDQPKPKMSSDGSK